MGHYASEMEDHYPEEKERPAIPRQLEALQNAVDQLEKAQLQLAERVRPILTLPEPEEKARDAEVLLQTASSSHVASCIADQTQRINRIADQLTAVMHRMEV